MKKKRLISIILGTCFFIPALIADRLTGIFWIYFPLYLLAYISAGWIVIKKAVKNISRGDIFDENFLMLIASCGAFVLNIVFGYNSLMTKGGGEEMMDGVLVMILYQVGELLQDLAVKKSRGNISSVLSMRPDSAILIKGGKEQEMNPEEIKPGDIIKVYPGSKIALDGIILTGSGYINTSAVTGESEPRFAEKGDSVLSGYISVDSPIEIRVTKNFEQSTASRMLKLIEEATEKKSRQESFITRFAEIYTPIVCSASLLIAVLVPLLIFFITGENAWNQWIYNGLCLLVISCPCALVISVPLTFFGGIGGLAKNNVLLKGADVFENIAKAGVAAMDKTGTLTTGRFSVAEIISDDKDKTLQIAASLEANFSHPIAKSICSCCTLPLLTAEDVKDHSGKGVSGSINGHTCMAGNEKLLGGCGIKTRTVSSPFTVIHVAENGTEIGCIICRDEIKKSSPEAVRMLNSLGMETVMLSGDNENVAEAIGKECGINKVHSSLLPENKLEIIRDYQHRGKTVMFAGDGINDGPALAAADAGCAMGSAGSDIAIESADAVIMKDSLTGLVTAKRHSRKVIAIAYENIIGSLLIKFALMILTLVLPSFPLYIAIMGDVGVCLLAVANSMRTLIVK